MGQRKRQWENEKRICYDSGRYASFPRDAETRHLAGPAQRVLRPRRQTTRRAIAVLSRRKSARSRSSRPRAGREEIAPRYIPSSLRVRHGRHRIPLSEDVHQTGSSPHRDHRRYRDRAGERRRQSCPRLAQRRCESGSRTADCSAKASCNADSRNTRWPPSSKSRVVVFRRATPAVHVAAHRAAAQSDRQSTRASESRSPSYFRPSR